MWRECFLIENDHCLSLLLQAGSQLESLSEEQLDGALLEACLHTLCLVYVSLQAKNPLRRAIARSFFIFISLKYICSINEIENTATKEMEMQV